MNVEDFLRKAKNLDLLYHLFLDIAEEEYDSIKTFIVVILKDDRAIIENELHDILVELSKIRFEVINPEQNISRVYRTIRNYLITCDVTIVKYFRNLKYMKVIYYRYGLIDRISEYIEYD